MKKKSYENNWESTHVMGPVRPIEMPMIWLLACLGAKNVPTRYQGSIPKKKEVARVISRSARSGLQFPVGR